MAKVSPHGEVASASFSAVGFALAEVAISLCCAFASRCEIASGVSDIGEEFADMGRGEVLADAHV